MLETGKETVSRFQQYFKDQLEENKGNLLLSKLYKNITTYTTVFNLSGAGVGLLNRRRSPKRSESDGIVLAGFSLFALVGV